jgi:hypothetical protein
MGWEADGPQGRSGHYIEQEIFLPLLGIEPRPSRPYPELQKFIVIQDFKLGSGGISKDHLTKATENDD